MSKHTPELWKAIRDVSSNRINIWADDGNEWIGEVEDMIDARLIAAAPDLLAACEKWLSGETTWSTTQAYEMAARAVAKAKGQP